MSKFLLLFLIALGLIFSGCSRKSRYYYSGTKSKPRTYSASKSVYSTTLSKKAYKHPTMRSYVVFGKRYYPKDVMVGDTFSGNASWYGPDFHGKLTSNGETYNMYDNTAAHKTLPMNTVVKVTNKRNGLTTVVRINDRGPFINTRIIDLSNTAAKKIRMLGAGTAPVSIEVLGFYAKNIRKNSVKRKRTVQKKTILKQTDKIGSFALQIASFANIEGAIKIQEQFNGTDGYKTVIKDVGSGYGRLFKVYLKGFRTEKEIRKYKSNGYFSNAFIVRD